MKKSRLIISVFLILTIAFSTCFATACKRGDIGNSDITTEPGITSPETGFPDSGDNTDPEPSDIPVAMDSTGRYRLTDNTALPEAIIDDVDMTYASAPDSSDNARLFYHIFVGSFSDSNGDGIGDLRGIINRLDYLNDGNPNSGTSLGVEGIWLSPIFLSPSYHKYDTTDYYRVDPSFGTTDDLIELTKLCHERGIKLILDLVINHTGNKNAWFLKYCKARISGDTANEYYNFYSTNDSVRKGSSTFSRIPSGTEYYECNFGGDMPEPDYDNEFVYNTFLDVAKYYLTEIGVDGFRFDAAKYIYYGETARSVEFWKRYINDLRAINPDIYTVAEVWDSDSMTVEYSPALNCFNFTMSQVDGMISATTKHGDVNNFTKYTESYINRLSPEHADSMPVSFLSNHDMDRAAGYMTYASGYAKMAANLYILNPGSSFVYYGEEIAMKGSRGSAATDSNRRLAMLWGDGDTVSNPVGSTFESDKQTNGTVASMLADGNSLYNHYKRLIMIRRANPEIARGEYHALALKDTKLGGFVSILNSSAPGSQNAVSGSQDSGPSDTGSQSTASGRVAVFHNTTGGPLTIDLATAAFTDGTPMSDLFDISACHIAATAYASMEYEKTESKLDGTLLTVAEQSTVVLR